MSSQKKFRFVPRFENGRHTGSFEVREKGGVNRDATPEEIARGFKMFKIGLPGYAGFLRESGLEDIAEEVLALWDSIQCDICKLVGSWCGRCECEILKLVEVPGVEIDEEGQPMILLPIPLWVKVGNGDKSCSHCQIVSKCVSRTDLPLAALREFRDMLNHILGE